MHSRRAFLFGCAAAFAPRTSFALPPEFNAMHFGATGNGITLDTHAVQKAIDAAFAAGGGRVILPSSRRFLVGSLVLRNRVDLHLDGDATLLASPNPADYQATQPGMLSSLRATGFKITGTGVIDGQAMKFMTDYSTTDERWEPKAFRPYMFSLVRSSDFEIHDVTMKHAPQWGLHMLGCERVLVDTLKVRNYMDVPNCDGIDPDHCRDVVIRNCSLEGADDSVVIKTSEQREDFGPSRNIHVYDCTMVTRDSGVKVGTETFADISGVLFERCKVISGGRGPTITHRQPGNIEDIEFRDIEVVAEHHAARWWGWGEPISVTAWPRAEGVTVGTLKNVRLRNIRAKAENSIRIEGQPEQPVRDVLLDNVHVTIDRWTKYSGEAFDNRPVKPSMAGLEKHSTPGFHLRDVDGARIVHCSVSWGANRQPYFSHALEAERVTRLTLEDFKGEAAFPSLQAIEMKP